MAAFREELAAGIGRVFINAAGRSRLSAYFAVTYFYAYASGALKTTRGAKWPARTH
jgi:hypothetical protein